jgi:hypothetical protein
MKHIIGFQVDDEDFEWLRRFRWYRKKGHALCKMNGQIMRMHRLIMATENDHICVHKESLNDNRRCNLSNMTIDQWNKFHSEKTLFQNKVRKNFGLQENANLYEW